jgi:CubicO group peptidase (beta-lactamase class C family)
MRHAIPILAGLLTACGGGGSGPTPDHNPHAPVYTSLAPDSMGDGWMPSTPAAEGIDAAALQSAFDAIQDGRYGRIDSMLVIRHGRLVAEGYFGGYARETLHDLRSTGKSFTSALTGIAIDRGLLDVDDRLSDLLPAFEGYANPDERKRAITVRHLLDMNSGLECNDWNPGSAGNEERMYHAKDWVKFILDLPMVREPGASAAYCTGGVVVLGYALSQRAGLGLDEFADANLFAPLGIRDVEWRRSPDGRATGGGGLKLKPRDAAKLGQLYLSGGTWNGARVLPAAWVDESRRSVERLGPFDYGLLWWKRSFAHGTGDVMSFFTSGNGGNFIFVVPALDLVVVFTGSNYDSSGSDAPHDIMASRVVPAAR